MVGGTPNRHSLIADADADDAMLHEALAILSDDAEDEDLGSEDGSFEPLPLPPTPMGQQPPPAAQRTNGFTSFGSSHSASSYVAQGPSYTQGQHPLRFDLFPTNSSSTTTKHHHHKGHELQPRWQSTMSSWEPSSHHIITEHHPEPQPGQQSMQPRRFSLPGACTAGSQVHQLHHLATEEQILSSSPSMAVHQIQQQQQPRQQPRRFSLPTPGSHAPLPMPLPLPAATPMNFTPNTFQRRSSMVSTASDSGCSSPASATGTVTATPNSSRSPSYNFPASTKADEAMSAMRSYGFAGSNTAEEAMFLPTNDNDDAVVSSNKKARHQ